MKLADLVTGVCVLLLIGVLTWVLHLYLLAGMGVAP